MTVVSQPGWRDGLNAVQPETRRSADDRARGVAYCSREFLDGHIRANNGRLRARSASATGVDRGSLNSLTRPSQPGRHGRTTPITSVEFASRVALVARPRAAPVYDAPPKRSASSSACSSSTRRIDSSIFFVVESPSPI